MAVYVAALLGTAGCGHGEAGSSEVRFAQMSGDVSVTDGDASVNLVIVAPVGDPVWSGMHELVVVNETDGGGDLVFGADSITLHPGTERDGLQVGSIPVMIPGEMEKFEVTAIDMVIGEGQDFTTYAVGDWRMERRAIDSPFSISGDYPVSLSECGEVAFELQRGNGADASITGIETGAPGLTITDVAVEVDDGGTSAITFDLTCDAQYDVYAFSPLLIVEEDGRTSSVPLDQILVGYLDMPAETVQRVLTR